MWVKKIFANKNLGPKKNWSDTFCGPKKQKMFSTKKMKI